MSARQYKHPHRRKKRSRRAHKRRAPNTRTSRTLRRRGSKTKVIRGASKGAGKKLGALPKYRYPIGSIYHPRKQEGA